jgi:hypothetical protein
VKIEIYNENLSGKDEKCGEFEISLAEIATTK